MAKKKGTKATKAKQGGGTKRGRGGGRAKEQAPAAGTTRAAGGEGATQAAPRERVHDPRLPPPGTVIEKRDRQGNVRCKCTVEEDGIRYSSKLYRSLSAAALAAAKDLGIRGRAQNGYTFFGLSKPPRRGTDAIEALGRAWERYRERVGSVVAGVKDEDRARVRGLIDEHAEAIKDLRRKLG